LEAWSRFNFTRSGKSDSPDFLLIQVPINVETLFRMGGAGEIKELSLDAHALWRQSLSVIDIKPSAHFKVDLNAPADLRTLFQLVNDLGHFMTLLIGEPSYVKKLRLCTSPDAIVDVFYPSTIRPEKKLHPAEMCFTLTEIQNIAPRLLGRWFTSLELLAPIYDLLFGTLFDPDSFVRTKFVNLTQALESFHRRTEGGTYISSGEFVVVRDALNAAIPTHTPSPLKQKLSDSIGYSNEYSLRKRLKELFQSLDRSTVEMLKIHDVAGTVEQIVKTRNYLTHFNEEQKTSMVDDVVAMHYMNERLTALLFVLIVRKLGIDESAAARGALKRRYFH
jgi:hypothetical protein